jgi:acyl-CoA reductase-like NAD-dependent aldehyde dehydrogenase
MTTISAAQFALTIDGHSIPSHTGETFTRINPYNGSIAGEYANADGADAERAIDAARAAFDHGPWPSTAARTRHDVLLSVARQLRENKDALAERMVSESGKPVSTAHGEIAGAANTFEYYAGAALASEGSAISERRPNALGLVLKEPLGVAAFITAWNFPLLGVVNKLAPALAAGCTTVVKPSHMCSGPTILLAEYLAAAGLPAGVFNVLTSDRDRGAEVGQILAASPKVDKVAFTGSTTSGRAVMKAAAENTKRVSLELGGKSANIVFEDADLEKAAATAISAFCYNSGQQCSAGSRLLVQRSIYDKFLDMVVNNVDIQVIGDPTLPETTMGPLISPDQFERVNHYIDIGDKQGQRATAVLPSPQGQNLVRPTIFEVDNASRLAQEEVFGPVLAVIAFDDESDAVEIANDSRYGLAGGVWTTDLNRALRVVKAIRTGKMFVNCYNTSGLDDMPHGGYKDSGFGREFGDAGLEEFLELKTVQVLLS